MKIVVTGATGYIGGRLIPELLKKGHRVRVLVRDSRRIQGRPWTSQVEVFSGDLLGGEDLRKVFDGVDAAYYLIHSMRAGGHFEERDREAVRHFVAAARNVPLVIYLGGLIPEGKTSSAHLLSRAEVGRILRENLPTTEFRAGPIIGSGSASFEMIRYLTERLPLMTAPRWILNPIQPLAVRDVLQYLVSALDLPPSDIVELGSQALTFKEMLQEYAAVRGLRRLILPVPVLAPRLAGRWVGLVTPIPNSMALPLVEGILQPLLADTRKARRLFPHIAPIPYRQAVELALEKTLSGAVETRWSGGVRDEEGQIREVRTLLVEATPAQVYREFASLGGSTGWLVWNWAWKLRGLIDRLAGGPGLRRGRRNPEELLPGEAVDFWRVEAADPPHLLRLRAEMKLPGKAWIQWEAIPEGAPEAAKTRLVQTAIFSPRGVSGALYGHVLYPAHRVIFSGLAKRLAARAALFAFRSKRNQKEASVAKGNSKESVDLKLEVVVIPVADVDRAKNFYVGLGWRLDGDFVFSETSRAVQVTPPGSRCSVVFGKGVTSAAPGSVPGFYLVVSDIEAARADLTKRGAQVSEPFHGGDNGERIVGMDPKRRSYFTFASFSDPDGNTWLLQEIKERLPGRVDPSETAFASQSELASALRRAEAAHGVHEKQLGHRDENWPEWYAQYMIEEQTGEKKKAA